MPHRPNSHKRGPLLIILSPLHTQMNCRKRLKKIHDYTGAADTSATRHFGTTKLVPKFKTNHR